MASSALPAVHASLILICDIVNFSRLTQNEQVEAVERLWGLFDTEDYGQWLERSRFNGTGDGLMLACATAKHREFVDLAQALIRHLQPLKLRVGLHQGPFSQPKPKAAPDHQAIGTGINQCARLCPLADAGDIAISEAFVLAWLNIEGPKIWSELSPEKGEPIEVFIKHGETLKLRFHRSALTAGRVWPVRIQTYDLARSELVNQIKDIEQIVVESLQKSFPEGKAAMRDVRVSLFTRSRMPGGDALELRATDIRYHRHGEYQDAGNVVYPIKWGGAGPVGRAFASGVPQAFNLFPDPKREATLYANALSKKTGLSIEQIGRFRRKAQTFIAFPFGLPHRPPDGAICVDIMDPLRGVTRKDLLNFAEHLQKKYGSIIALYWRLRAHL